MLCGTAARRRARLHRDARPLRRTLPCTRSSKSARGAPAHDHRRERVFLVAASRATRARENDRETVGKARVLMLFDDDLSRQAILAVANDPSWTIRLQAAAAQEARLPGGLTSVPRR